MIRIFDFPLIVPNAVRAGFVPLFLDEVHLRANS